MEVHDVNVRVLYDFEYSTKDGRKIKITTGERLFLIAKTNSDWWHVIRSSERRPFYVPATYVQEIPKGEEKGVGKEKKEDRTNSKGPKVKKEIPSPDLGVVLSESGKEHQSLIQVIEEPIGFNMGYRNRSCSLEDKKMFSVKLSSDDRQRILKGKLGLTPLPKFAPPPEIDEDKDAEVDYVNLRKSEDDKGFIIDDDVVPDIKFPQHSRSVDVDLEVDGGPLQSEMPAAIDTIDEKRNKSPPQPAERSGYSFVSNPIKGEDATTTVSHEMDSLSPISQELPHSNSLEELALEIELKTNSLKSNAANTAANTGSLEKEKYILPSTSDNSVESNIDSAFDSSESIKEVTRIRVDDDDDNPISSPVPLQRKLRYVGSFKTKQEREKWARQHTSDIQESETGSWGPDNHRQKSAAVEIVKPTENITIINKMEEKLLQSSDSSTHLEPNNSNTKNVLSIMVNCEDTSAANFNVSNSFIESSRKTEEHLLQIQQNLGIAQEASARIEKYSPKQALRTLIDRDSGMNKPSLESMSDEKKSIGKYSVELRASSSLKDSLESVKCSNSEKGSTDSLLDIDKNLNNRKISTTSESVIHTDGEDVDGVNSDSETDSVILGLSRMQQNKTQEPHKRKTSLIRNRRVEACKTRSYLQQPPPSPTPSQKPTRTLSGSWNEFVTSDGRVFFYNTDTGERSWKPPRRRFNSNDDKKKEGNLTNVYSGSSSPLAESDEQLFQRSLENIPLPAGWKTRVDEESGLPCYINILTGAKWFSSSDSAGRVYYFEENSNESSWTLPELSYVTNINEFSLLQSLTSASTQPKPPDVPAERNYNRVSKSKSMICDDRKEDVPAPQPKPKNWPNLEHGVLRILREGTLNRTKITENGKRLRKNWSSCYVVLNDLYLMFFKDHKSFSAMKSATLKPEMCIDLSGMHIDRGDKFSNRKNVFIISPVLAMQILIQCDSSNGADEWLEAIQSAISNLPCQVDRCMRIPKMSKEHSKDDDADEGKKSRIGRSKSVKMKKEGSIEDLSLTSAERQTKIKAKLRKFFQRRPTVEALEKKGIYKDEPVFGCYLDCGNENPRVPYFVRHCIECIEKTEENMKTDGLYRASGNLSQVQKIRLQVDQHNWAVLDQEEDVHVLTGALKLYFRELKTPLIPTQYFNKAIKASTNHVRSAKISSFKDILKNLPSTNFDTLKFLLEHLRRVTNYQEFNRMHIPNLAIVFGPTLMRPEQESLNMAFDLMQQNLVIECLLMEFESIFAR
ncbi:rho GTPase-activating protein 12 isoform X1 [Nilaparvata lugens]|uniref:rho GTPase-activating protein 12 isoform X1 n=1 Tax=Nilaparvata lugens TaxID=108931 RepID=UPI00193DD15C|nr:rho GTPase-activating protein 12 isoform X1 [Nilaparvata lugens]